MLSRRNLSRRSTDNGLLTRDLNSRRCKKEKKKSPHYIGLKWYVINFQAALWVVPLIRRHFHHFFNVKCMLNSSTLVKQSELFLHKLIQNENSWVSFGWRSVCTEDTRKNYIRRYTKGFCKFNLSYANIDQKRKKKKKQTQL